MPVDAHDIYIAGVVAVRDVRVLVFHKGFNLGGTTFAIANNYRPTHRLTLIPRAINGDKVTDRKGTNLTIEEYVTLLAATGIKGGEDFPKQRVVTHRAVNFPNEVEVALAEKYFFPQKCGVTDFDAVTVFHVHIGYTASQMIARIFLPKINTFFA